MKQTLALSAYILIASTGLLGCKKQEVLSDWRAQPKSVSAEKSGNHDTTSPEEDAKKGILGIGYSDGFYQYKKAEVSPGKWQWVVDEEAMNYQYAAQKERDDLWNALTTRVLTPVEFKKVLDRGSSILVSPMQSYRQEEIDRRFQAGLEIQATLRRMESDAKASK